MLSNSSIRYFVFVVIVLLLYLKFYWIAGILLFVFVSLLGLGAYFIQWNFFTTSLNHGDRTKKQIAITFDDGPFAEFTPQVLDILLQEKVPAAFFVIGKNIIGNEAILKRIIAENHIIGNHSFSHNFWFSMKSKDEMLHDLRQTDTALENVIHKKAKLFRPPYGVTNPMVAQAIQKGNYTSIGWSIRTFDTTIKDKEKLLQKTTRNIQNGDVILFHDWGHQTIAILPEFIHQIRAKGFEIVGLDILLKTKPYF